ncbi:P-loop containing nucleoside triphosphate hydrolases superfamily protein isoform X2 [Wolffia australiana]
MSASGGTFSLLNQIRLPCSKFYGGRIELSGPSNLCTLVRRRISSVIYVTQELQLSTKEASAKGDTAADKKPLKAPISVGAFQMLPMVMPSEDLIMSAKRKARRVGPSKGIVNIAKREKNKAAKQLDALMKEIAVPLRLYLEKFPKRYLLHPYERSLIELTFGEGHYEEVLGRVDSLRKRILSVGKEHASLCAQSSTKREAEERLDEGVKSLEHTFHLQRHAVEDLLNIAKALRAMPVVDPSIPTLCLVGAPNVGKSSLVRILSTGKPEVCNYPFTTRGILMGHISIDYAHFQVTDTPGLLNREDEKRNNLEKLTLAVLSHLPTAVLYVHDLTGDCGTSPSNQFALYKEIRERFKDHIWLDVVSKCDLLHLPDRITESDDELENYKSFGPPGSMRVSVKSELGLDELKGRVHDLLMSQMSRIKEEATEGETSDLASSDKVKSVR